MVAVASHARTLNDRGFFRGIALALGAVAFVGFAPTYYLVAFNDAVTPELTTRLHVHAALSTAWIVLLIVQTQLIAAGKRHIHRLLGYGGAVVALATVVSGVIVALNSGRRIHTAATSGTLADPYVFLMFPLMSVGLFALFVALAVVKRNRPDSHKRLMILGTLSLIIPALARLVTMVVKGFGMVGLPGVVGAMLLVNVFLIALVIRDYRTLGRLHPVTLWGGGLFVLSEPLRFAVAFSEPWQQIARSLMTWSLQT